MTTIAYKDGVLAADTQINYGSFSNGNISKIRAVIMGKGADAKRVMVAMSGAVWVTQPLIEWIEEGATQETIPHCLLHAAADFTVLMVEENGSVWEFNNGYFIPCMVEYHALGSGQMFALGAMAAGVSAPEAVAAAMKHDKATGGEIHTLDLADLTEVKKAA